MSSTVGVAIDHVLIGVPDLDAAAATFDHEYGLRAAGGGRHPGWGTANRVVPCGPTYLELVTVVDGDEAAGSAFGRWVARMVAGTAPPTAWAVRTDDIHTVAARLDLEVIDGSRRTASDAVLQWSLAGVSQASERPGMPFFIQWAPGTSLPGSTKAEHRAGGVAMRELHLECDRTELVEWLGTADLPVRVTPGTRGLTAIVLDTTDGDVVIEPGLSTRRSTPPPR